jgi:hypothetical protein
MTKIDYKELVSFAEEYFNKPFKEFDFEDMKEFEGFAEASANYSLEELKKIVCKKSYRDRNY